MSDTVERARTARTQLAEALSLLQSDEAGSLVDTVAEPVARAMGALHQLETAGGVGVAEKALIARDAVREALATLQSAPVSRTAEQVTEIIAGSLGLLHGLAQDSQPPAATPATTTSMGTPASKNDPASEAPAPIAQPSTSEKKLHLAATEPQGRNSPIPKEVTPLKPAPAGGLDMTVPLPSKSPLPQHKTDFAATQASVGYAPEPEAAVVADLPPPVQVSKSEDFKHATLPPEADAVGALFMEANLGAHSPTNFYKGLSGNDIVDDGGLFVSTYDIPPLGSKIRLIVNMPGGYDFSAIAVVKWTRESGAGDAPPGFGCSFVSISKEARQLIYRYARNREPLFHDDF